MSEEDAVVSSIIRTGKFDRALPEVHYNHYGDRGVVDLFGKVEEPSHHSIYEVKSEAAVRSATGANEIIRQYNRMRNYFYKGTDHSKPKHTSYNLYFTATTYNLWHIHTNAEMYRSLLEQSGRGCSDYIGLRFDNDSMDNLLMFSNEGGSVFDYRELGGTWDDFSHYLDFLSLDQNALEPAVSEINEEVY
jgi:hypothetical protein